MWMPRMTTRRWMIAVAVVGIIVAGVMRMRRLRKLRWVYLAVARQYAFESHEIRLGDDARSDYRHGLIRR